MPPAGPATSPGCTSAAISSPSYTPPLRREFSDISYPTLLKAAGYHTGFIGKFGVAVNGIEPSLEDAGGLERMFDHFDNYEHWNDEGYEIRQPDGGYAISPTSPATTRWRSSTGTLPREHGAPSACR